MNIKKIFSFLFLISSICMICSFSYAKGWVEEYGEWVYYDNDGSLATETIKTSGDDRYYLDENGVMVRDYLLEHYNDHTYYFDEDGKMVKDTWVAVDPYQVENYLDDGPTIYLYYFGSNGMAYQATNDIVKKTIDGKKYLFDSEGRMLSGWINESGEMFSSQDISDDPFVDEYVYYAGDETDGVLREGWLEYTDGSLDERYYEKSTLWFYFGSNNKKIRYESSNGTIGTKYNYRTKKINGHTYAFDDNGVMLTGWDVEPATQHYSEVEYIEGQLDKKKWIYAVPSEEIYKKDHEANIERWFYASNNGDITKSIVKKINDKEYVFDHHGIMKSGLVVLNKKTKKYIDTIYIEATDGKDFIVNGIYINKDDEKECYFDKNTEILYYFIDSEWDENYGARDVGENTLSFSDRDYTYKDEKSGEIEGYKTKDKKYYQNGILLKAYSDMGYGLVLVSYASPSTIASKSNATEYEKATYEMKVEETKKPKVSNKRLGDFDKEDYNVYKDVASAYNGYDDTNPSYTPLFYVVNHKGKVMNKKNVLKDKSGEYWIIGNNNRFIKVVSCEVKYNRGEWTFKSEFNDGESNKTKFMPFGTIDAYGNTVTFRPQKTNGYDVVLNEQYALNFKWED